MATPSKNIDRRAKRTRQVLEEAFLAMLDEKGFTAMSIQEITERANVHRGTFYAHFADKYALLEAVIRERFRDALTSELPPIPQWEQNTLHLLIEATLEYFKGTYHQCSSLHIVDPLTEKVIREELATFLVIWLKQGKNAQMRWQLSVEMTAELMSWTILGAAIQWSQNSTTMTAEKMARHVVLMLLEGVTHLASSALPG
ncbi:TetR/AcrR family transcriptional regulator [Ktedonosporobacter rubrisoli]|uniref:TetR/AcrR family transcriptional regulator n=1 Tax=Ktedonosporobacter rubrisoli TaxID=2509675 RepID=A0A4P6JMQ2_KTERU|nr:TetR/AcrR family transcriptional regulator [Ktedonosporobacter rubrisoli]QBD75966.1 TetR/AcrR family transcriptional regulator [Ktedonosporobacter rubrisoli]